MTDKERIAIIEHFVSGIPVEQMSGVTLEQWLESNMATDLIDRMKVVLNDNQDSQVVHRMFELMGLMPVSSLLASLLSTEFALTGAINYLEQTFYTEKFGEIVVTAQRKDGLTPCEKLEAAEKEIENLKLVLGNKINNEI
ncbi:hypothetical protein [Providencia sp. PROV089]|uniref:hypothetical protein n=1 Tax=Providencia sp. PROV089 TaxID=2949805 RepID=UPI00234A0658|nr:hypothetical protein [Providencia sp. PROV089]